MLTNEYFKISTRIENEHDIVLDNVSLIITVPSHFRNKGIKFTFEFINANANREIF